MDDGTRKSLLFREVNEKIRHVNAQWDAADAAGFFCECSDTRCNETLSLTYAQYEAIRAASEGFVVLQGHDAHKTAHVVAADGPAMTIEAVPPPASASA